MKRYIALSNFLTEYVERNTENSYPPVAVGRYGIRSRESIYSKELAKDYSKNKLIRENTLTVGMGSVQMDIGILTENVVYSVSPAYHTYKISGINSKYLEYCLECRNHDMFSRFVKRGSRQGKSIDLKRWLTYEIPVYDEQKQVEIVGILNRISALIETRKKELEYLEQIVKSRFIEMFGDPNANKTTIDEVCSIITDGTHQSPKFQQEGIPFIFVSNIAQNEITYNAEKFISEETYNELIKRTPIEIGDVLLSTVGSYGHPAIVKENRKFLFQRHIAYLKPKHEIINSVYLYGAILSRDVQEQIDERVKGIAQKTLNLSEIRKIVIPLPEMNKQNKFADFVAQTDKSKYLSCIFANELKNVKENYYGSI